MHHSIFPFLFIFLYSIRCSEDTYPTPTQSIYEQLEHQYQEVKEFNEHSTVDPSPEASVCLARIRLAASFDPTISNQINRFIDSLRIDRLRSYVCERTAVYCNEYQQHEVGKLFNQYNQANEIIEQVKRQMSSTEKDQINMMENLNDTLAEQSFFLYKFHVLPPVELAILTAAKNSITKALTSNQPDAQLSRAMGTFTPEDFEKIQSLPISSIPGEVQSHLARCQITSPDTINDVISFILSIHNSKQI